MTPNVTRRHDPTATPEVAMRAIVVLLALVGAVTAGCLQVQPQPPLPATTVTSWGPAGGFTMSSGSTCAGHATLIAGHASVSDRCFTGVDNIVMCTDTTAPNAVQCSPGYGYLTISGAGGDTISYARMK
jgi:hypothetical protein